MSVAQKDGKDDVTIGIFIVGSLEGFGGFLGRQRYCARKKAHGNQDRNAVPHV